MSVTTMQASGSKPVFTCSECSATYSRMEYLRRHERKHTESRPFQCEECMKSFARSDVLLRHRRRCHPEAEAIREANAMIDSQAEAAPSVTSGRAKLKAAGLTKRAQGKFRQNEASSSPEVNGSPDASSSNKQISTRFVHGPSPPSSAAPSANVPVDFGSFSFANDVSSEMNLLTRNTPDDQSIVSLEAPSSISLSGESSTPAWDSLPPLSIFGPSAIIPKTGSEVTQFGAWYSFPPRRARSQSGSSDQRTETADNLQADPLFQSYMLGDAAVAEQLGADLLSPERTTFNAECRSISERLGAPLDPAHKFYISPGLFAGCYTIPHWLLPPLKSLSEFAATTLSEHLVQFPLVHQATFKLSKTPHWLAFAMCTVGGLNPEEFKLRIATGNTVSLRIPGAPYEGIQGIVRTEKVDMLVKTFVRQSAKLPLCDQVSIIQSLLLFNTPSFLSEDPSERIVGHLFLTTIVKVVRKSGLFHPSADYASRLSMPTEAPLDSRWHKWVQHETSRRCAWFIYILDIIACLEAGVPSLISPRDVLHLAVPASESMWSAQSENEWAALAETGGFLVDGMSLDMAMQAVFGFSHPATEGQPDAITGVKLGPFARTAIVMTILRGLIDFGQGKPKGGFVTQCWVTNGSMSPNGGSANYDLVVSTYMRALIKWRQGWDLDPLCTFLTTPQVTSPPATNSVPPTMDGQGAPSSPAYNITTRFFANTTDTTARLKEPVFANDALPYYWLALVLVDMLKPGIAACASYTSGPQPQATTVPGQDMGQGSDPMLNDLLTGEMSLNDMLHNHEFAGISGGSARIVDLEEQNNKFAEVDFTEMLAIAKDFARGDTGTIRALSMPMM